MRGNAGRKEITRREDVRVINFPNRSFHGNKNLSPLSNFPKINSGSYLAHTLSADNESLLSYRKMKLEEKSFMRRRPSFQIEFFLVKICFATKIRAGVKGHAITGLWTFPFRT